MVCYLLKKEDGILLIARLRSILIIRHGSYEYSNLLGTICLFCSFKNIYFKSVSVDILGAKTEHIQMVVLIFLH